MANVSFVFNNEKRKMQLYQLCFKMIDEKIELIFPYSS